MPFFWVGWEGGSASGISGYGNAEGGVEWNGDGERFPPCTFSSGAGVGMRGVYIRKLSL